MVRTTIVLPEDEFEELKRLAAKQERPISWLLRQAFRLSKVHLERGEPYGVTFDRVWSEIGQALRRTGVRPSDVTRLVAKSRKKRGEGVEGSRPGEPARGGHQCPSLKLPHLGPSQAGPEQNSGWVGSPLPLSADPGGVSIDSPTCWRRPVPCRIIPAPTPKSWTGCRGRSHSPG